MTPELEQKIRSIIRDEFQRNYYAGVPHTPPHSHNGIDNVPIQSVNIEGPLVSSIIAGTDISISPASGTGDVTINSTSTGATPGGSDTSIQFNDAGDFGGDDDFTFHKQLIGFDFHYHLVMAALEIQASNAAAAILTTIHDSSGLGIQLSSDDKVEIAPGVGNVVQIFETLQLFNGSDPAGGEQVVALADATVAPSGTPFGGGVLYSDAGALHWKGSGGTDTVIAPA